MVHNICRSTPPSTALVIWKLRAMLLLSYQCYKLAINKMDNPIYLDFFLGAPTSVSLPVKLPTPSTPRLTIPPAALPTPRVIPLPLKLDASNEILLPELPLLIALWSRASAGLDGSSSPVPSPPIAVAVLTWAVFGEVEDEESSSVNILLRLPFGDGIPDPILARGLEATTALAPGRGANLAAEA